MDHSGPPRTTISQRKRRGEEQWPFVQNAEVALVWKTHTAANVGLHYIVGLVLPQVNQGTRMLLADSAKEQVQTEALQTSSELRAHVFALCAMGLGRSGLSRATECARTAGAPALASWRGDKIPSSLDSSLSKTQNATIPVGSSDEAAARRRIWGICGLINRDAGVATAGALWKCSGEKEPWAISRSPDPRSTGCS